MASPFRHRPRRPAGARCRFDRTPREGRATRCPFRSSASRAMAARVLPWLSPALVASPAARTPAGPDGTRDGARVPDVCREGKMDGMWTMNGETMERDCREDGRRPARPLARLVSRAAAGARRQAPRTGASLRRRRLAPACRGAAALPASVRLPRAPAWPRAEAPDLRAPPLSHRARHPAFDRELRTRANVLKTLRAPSRTKDPG